jgi:hypothetical protein
MMAGLLVSMASRTRSLFAGASHADVDHGVRVLSGSLNTLELPRLVSLWRRRQRIVDLCANFGDIIAQIHTIEQIALKDGTSLLKQCR